MAKGTRQTPGFLVWQRGQGNFELAANFGYSSRGSADPRESLRKRRISKLALTAHKVFPLTDPLTQDSFFGWLLVVKRCVSLLMVCYRTLFNTTHLPAPHDLLFTFFIHTHF